MNNTRSRVLLYSLMFIAGFLSCLLVTLAYNGAELPLSSSENSTSASAPGDWIKESQIQVSANKIVIDVSGASLSRYAATGSMKPVLDSYSNGIRIVPSEEQIKVGDIVTYERNGELIVHRVIEIGNDSLGRYFIVKGDNNSVEDGKIRFSDIRYVTIGVLY